MISISPWFERSFRFGLEGKYFPLVVERLHGTRIRLPHLLVGVSPQTLVARDGGAWSIQEHAGHLVDLEPLWYSRIDDILSGETEMRSADLTNQATHEAGHNDRPIQDIIADFADHRERLTSRLDSLLLEEAEASALHPRLKQPMRVIDLAVFVAEHDDHHLATIRQRLRTGGAA